ncbi:MAG: serine/threonine protein kinase [Nitriliruptor sp.]|nr:MAG: serine/threonine protein kinase [Nitriliruptor sp.]
MELDSGTVLAGRWELQARLASGGMGDVYRGLDTRLGRRVAVKVLRVDETVARRRFEAEAITLSNLQHPNVVVLFDAGEHEDISFLIMEFVDGPSLGEVLDAGPMDLERLREMGRDIASALAYAHDQHIVHRDVKPSNVLFDQSGVAHLADFGISRLVDDAGLTATGTAIGTAAYLAPEQLTDGPEVAPAADVYSLGLVLLEAATGRREFSGSGTEAAFARLSRDPVVPEHLPAAWRRLFSAMTARDPQERPSAADVTELLEAGLPRDETQLLVSPGWQEDAATEVIDHSPGGGEPRTRELTSEPAVEAPVDPDGGGFVERVRGWGPYAAAALVGIAVILLLFAGLGTGEDPTEPAAPDRQLPVELEDAFDELLDTVRP